MKISDLNEWQLDQESRSQSPYSLSIVVPVLNEEESVHGFIKAVDEVLFSDEGDTDLLFVEYLFVNDGSTDHTEFVLRQLAKSDERITLINLSRNFGKEAALSAGLEFARGDAVIPMDVDLQDPPSLLPQMIEKWRSGAKVVNARRVDRSSDTRFKRWTSAMFYKLINRLSDYDIPRDVGDFRLLDRDAVSVINQLTEHSRFNKGLFSWIGFETATVEYARPERSVGSTKWRVGKLLGLALDGVIASSTLPLRIWTALGASIAFGAFAYALFLLIRTTVFGIDVPGYASIMVTVLILGGLNLVSLGLIGEYLGRVSMQVRGRPLYVVGSVIGGAQRADSTVEAVVAQKLGKVTR